MIFHATSNQGNLSLGSDYNRARFKDFLKKNDGVRLEIKPITPESKEQRGFFEGAVIPLLTYYQEGLDHRKAEDCATVREWLKIEFNGEIVEIKGKAHKLAKSTKGKLNQGFLERVLDWMTEQGYQTELLQPDDYKYWRDAIQGIKDGPDNYLDFLIAEGKLR